ncbi:PREDICTED: multidrug resistance protein 1-like [Priapulus caudatus]|uniref:Multidrug resistance protein 1-like n=1 Tax=Priapulus caudatus TaxID=37621 RepID=A0ABM1DQ52_PRICU|nr:PREDICTED: multidrug resistance protein 1-like [Priapulus caudatus]
MMTSTSHDEEDSANQENSLYKIPLSEITVPSPSHHALMEEKALASPPEEQEEEKIRPVGNLEIFRFADKWDKLFMFVGTAAALFHGAALPLMIIVFGDMTDSFVKNAIFTQITEKMEELNITGELGNCTGLTSPECIEGVQHFLDMLGINLGYDLAELAEAASITDLMRRFAVLYIGIGCGVFVFAYMQISFWAMAGERQSHLLRQTFFRAVMRQEIGWFDVHHSGGVSTQLVDNIAKFSAGIGDKLGIMVQWVTACITGFIIGFTYGWKLTLVILSVSPLLVFSAVIVSKLAAAMSTMELKAYATAGAVAEEVFMAIRTVVAFGGQEKEADRYSQNLVAAKKMGIRKGMMTGLGMGFAWVVIFSTYGLAFWYGSRLVRESFLNGDEEYTPGILITVFFAVMIGAFALGHAAPHVADFATARGAAAAIFKTIDSVPSIDVMSETGEKPNNLVGDIEFKNVFFKYPSRPDVKVLEGLSFSVKNGQTVALVGPSGCGKSTTVQLIQRFYDVESGSVSLDGNDVRSLNVRWLRERIGVVGQEPVLFATTIAENIRYGCGGVTNHDIEQAAMMANAHDFILKLPEKYQTLVGERGAQLSGGQKQRVAIARALVRNPRILLLDEATSALDTESEATVQAALDKARQGRTTIIIAHRLSTIKTADMIVVVQEGQVGESGRHLELMEREGLYYELVMAQEDLKSLPPVDMMRLMKLNAPEWPYISVGCVAAAANGAVMPMFAIIFAEVLGVFSIPDINEQERKSNLYSLMFLLIGVAAGITMFLQGYLFGYSGENLTMRVRYMGFTSMLKQEIGWFDDKKNTVGALLTRLATDSANVQGATGVRLGSLANSVSNLVAGLTIAFVNSWKMTLVILSFVPFIIVGAAMQMKMLAGNQHADKKAFEESGRVAAEAIDNVRTVASLSKEQHFCNQYSRNLVKPHSNSLKMAHLYGVAFSFSQAIIFFAYSACFYYGSVLIQNEGLDYTKVFKVFAAIIFGAMAMGQASSFAPDYAKAKTSSQRLAVLFDRVPLIDGSSTAGETPDTCEGSVEFSSVEFKYPMRPDVKVLQDFSLSVTPGKVMALVGSSGCGKSTTVQLLERFYDTTEGVIRIDGRDVKQLNVRWLRRQIGLVSQEPILFDRTIATNIAYGDNSRDVPMHEVVAAARDANIHAFISSLPQGYDTNVGEKGTQLSGGQKQRVAIARALVRNPRILLLDEATSALDTASEKVVQEALDKAQQGRTSITIAHRLSTVRDADNIAVIQRGRVSEHGKHDALLAAGGLYCTLVSSQLHQQ